MRLNQRVELLPPLAEARHRLLLALIMKVRLLGPDHLAYGLPRNLQVPADGLDRFALDEMGPTAPLSCQLCLNILLAVQDDMLFCCVPRSMTGYQAKTTLPVVGDRSPAPQHEAPVAHSVISLYRVPLRCCQVWMRTDKQCDDLQPVGVLH